MRNSIKVVAALTFALCSTAGAQQTAVSAAPPNSVVINFTSLADGTPVTNQFAAQGVTVSGNAYANTAYSGYFGTGNNVQLANFSPSCSASTCQPVTFTFANPVTFFGFNAISNGTVTFTDSNGSTTMNSPVSYPANFTGFTDATPFSSVTVSASGNGAFAVDNVSFSSTPEPSSVALLGTGIVGLVPMIRRKRKA